MKFHKRMASDVVNLVLDNNNKNLDSDKNQL